MSLEEIVVNQLVFVLGAPDAVLDPDSAVGQLQDVLSSLAQLSGADLSAVRRIAEGQLDGPVQADVRDALRELVLLLDEIEAA